MCFLSPFFNNVFDNGLPKFFGFLRIKEFDMTSIFMESNFKMAVVVLSN